jgi:hypothetical protein
MKRKYNFKDLPMVLTALTLVENFTAEKAAFIAENAAWADPYETNIRAIIAKALKDYFGINTKEQLKEVTRLVNQLQGKALDDLGAVKSEIKRGFRKDPVRCDVLLDTLGYKQYWVKGSHNNQTEIIGLLLKFSNNITESSRTEMVANKVSDTRITSVLAFAKSLHEANITQETLKGTSKINTEEAVTFFNDIYEQAMDICEVGKRIFKKDKVRRGMFVFAQVLKKQGINLGSKPAEPAEGTPTTATSK